MLLSWWRNRRGGRTWDRITPAEVTRWAADLIAFYGSNAIVTPIYLEVVGGVTDRRELALTLVFLGRFRCVDERDIPADDWRDAERIARRIPRKRTPRDMGDCVIRAIANRLKYAVHTFDTNFPG